MIYTSIYIYRERERDRERGIHVFKYLATIHMGVHAGAFSNHVHIALPSQAQIKNPGHQQWQDGRKI